MTDSIKMKVSLEAARRSRMTGSVADMFVQDRQRTQKTTPARRRQQQKPKRVRKPHLHYQVVRIRNSEDPVSAFFDEPFIVRKARMPIQRLLNYRFFYDLDDLADGLAPDNAFTRAMRYVFKLNYDRGENAYTSGVGDMLQALAIPGVDARWLYGILDGGQQIYKTELDRLLTGTIQLIQSYRHELGLMWAYSEVARSGGLLLADLFPEEYAPAVRLAMMMERLTSLSFIDGMFPKDDRLRSLGAYAIDLNFDRVAQSIFCSAHGYQRDNFHRVEDSWASYFLLRGNYLHAASLVAKKARRLMRLFQERGVRDCGFNAWTEYWRAADIARFGAENLGCSADCLRLLRISRSHLQEAIRIMELTEQPKRRGARLRKARREGRIYGALADVNGAIHTVRAAVQAEREGFVNHMPPLQEFGVQALQPDHLVAFPPAQRFPLGTRPALLR